MDIKDESTGKVIAKVTAADPNIDGCDEGVWVEVQADDGTRPTLCLIKDKKEGHHGGSWYLGVYRDVKNLGIGCDLSILFDKEKGPQLQVIKGKQAKIVDLFDMLPGVVK